MPGVSESTWGDSREEEATNGLFFGFFKICELCTDYPWAICSLDKVQESMIGQDRQNTEYYNKECRFVRLHACDAI